MDVKISRKSDHLRACILLVRQTPREKSCPCPVELQPGQSGGSGPAGATGLLPSDTDQTHRPGRAAPDQGRKDPPLGEGVFDFSDLDGAHQKGKTQPNVEFGKSLAVTSDQYHLKVDWQIAEGQADSELTLTINAYNLHKIARELLRQRRAEVQRRKADLSIPIP
jgi:hypothetical protein